MKGTGNNEGMKAMVAIKTMKDGAKDQIRETLKVRDHAHTVSFFLCTALCLCFSRRACACVRARVCLALAECV